MYCSNSSAETVQRCGRSLGEPRHILEILESLASLSRGTPTSFT